MSVTLRALDMTRTNEGRVEQLALVHIAHTQQSQDCNHPQDRPEDTGWVLAQSEAQGRVTHSGDARAEGGAMAATLSL